MFYDDNNELVSYSTYSNFTIGPEPDFAITSLGTYHGVAGDGLRSLLNKPFKFPESAAPGAAWWGKDLSLSMVPSEAALEDEDAVIFYFQMRNNHFILYLRFRVI